MKNFFIALFFLISLCTVAQKQSLQYALQGGYKYYMGSFGKQGFNIGMETTYYPTNRNYILLNFNYGNGPIADGNIDLLNNGKAVYYTGNRKDYFIGMGLGYNVLNKQKNRIYIQGAIGLGIVTINMDFPSIKGKGHGNQSQYALSPSLGYDYKITDKVAVGINYSGYYIGNWEYSNTINGKLSFTF